MAIFILAPDPDGNCCGCEGRTSPCDTCGEPPVEACALSLPLCTPFSPQFSTLAEAEAEIANYVASCFAYIGAARPSRSTPTSFVAQILSSTRVTVDAAMNGALDFETCINVSVVAGTTLAIDFSGAVTTSPSAPNAAARLYDAESCSLVDNDFVSGTSGTLSVIAPSSGSYYLVLLFGSPGSLPYSVAISYDINSDATMVINPVIANYDSGQIEACPKMLLPPLTESTGDSYEDCASAAAANANTSNCIGYPLVASPLGNTQTLDASFSGSTLTMEVSADVELFVLESDKWASINGEDGETVTFTVSGTDAGLHYARIYDYAGALVWSGEILIGATTVTSDPLPYTGRYIILISPTADDNTVTTTITSSGTLSVNQIQSLYDVGLTCLGRLNCGDSC